MNNSYQHIITCREPWFSYLRQGIKEVEGREGLKKYRKIKIGEKILFQNESKNQYFLAVVIKIDEFKTLDDYLVKSSIEKALPGVNSMQEGKRIYQQMIDPKDIEKYGFLGIWIRPLEN